MACADGIGQQTAKAELELLSWNKIVDVTKDKGVIKKILKESTDYKTATAESTVTVRYVLETFMDASMHAKPAHAC